MSHIPEDLRLLHTYAKDNSIRELVERIGDAEYLNRELLEALRVIANRLTKGPRHDGRSKVQRAIAAVAEAAIAKAEGAK